GHEHQTPSLVRGGSMRVTMPMAGTILLVEDDDSVRLPAAEFLKMEGFKVLQASTGAEAMQVVARSHSPIDVLVTDVVMPVMSGCEVAEALLASQPNLRVLFISGDSDKAVGLASNGKANGPILQKPFRLEVLGARINELLQDKL